MIGCPNWNVLLQKLCLLLMSLQQNLPIWAAHHMFLESGHPEDTKNPYQVWSPEGS